MHFGCRLNSTTGWTLLAVLAVGLPAVRPASAQTTLTPGDSARIRVATLRALDGSSRPDPSARLWIRGERRSAETWRALSTNVLAGLRTSFPRAVVVDPKEDLFECPAGRTVHMPGRGCPIREGGRIAAFLPIRPMDDGTMRTGAALTYSAADGRWTAVAEVTVLVARVGDDWVVTRVLSRGTT